MGSTEMGSPALAANLATPMQQHLTLAQDQAVWIPRHAHATPDSMATGWRALCAALAAPITRFQPRNASPEVQLTEHACATQASSVTGMFACHAAPVMLPTQCSRPNALQEASATSLRACVWPTSSATARRAFLASHARPMQTR